MSTFEVALSQALATIDEKQLLAATPLQRVEYLMARLRDKEAGCPWDIKQTYQSVIPYTIEETYEVVDAIEKGDKEHLKEELGDLLFQVFFYAQIAKEDGEFDLHDVAAGLVTKLVRRHPHVFPEGVLHSWVDKLSPPSEEEIRGRWDQIKAEEKRAKAQSQTGQSQNDAAESSLLDDIPEGMAPLLRAQKLQKKVAKKGFDWPSMDLVLDKLDEEVGELRQALQPDTGSVDIEAVADEIGDVLFSTINVARFAKLDAELIMKKANDKFQRRFQGVEAFLAEHGETLDSVDLERMEQGWQHVKAQEALSKP